MEERVVSEQAPPAEMKKEKPDRIPLPEDLNKEKKQIVKKNKILKKLKSRLGRFLNLKKRSFLILIK
jgi:BioD-like phosphotransacetylase family protein